MKKVFSLLLIGVFMVVGAAQAEDRIVFVDVQEVFKGFYKTQLAQDQIRQQADDIKLEREEMEEEVLALKEEIEVLRADARDEMLSTEVRASKRDLLEEKLVNVMAKEREMGEFDKLRREQLEKQNMRMTRTLFDEIHEAVILYAKAQGFTSVIDRSAKSKMGIQIVLFAQVDVDITADLLAVLNEDREGFEIDELEAQDEE